MVHRCVAAALAAGCVGAPLVAIPAALAAAPPEVARLELRGHQG